MASQSTGIQQLLAAEKRAAEKVAEARKSKKLCLLTVQLHINNDIHACTFLYSNIRIWRVKEHRQGTYWR